MLAPGDVGEVQEVAGGGEVGGVCLVGGSVGEFGCCEGVRRWARRSVVGGVEEEGMSRGAEAA